MNYQEFIQSKVKTFIKSGFDIDQSELNPKLKDFQKYCVQKALKNGRFGLFEDCGLGKSFQAIEWAYQVTQKTNGSVLILTVLAVVDQFIEEGQKLGREVKRLGNVGADAAIYVTNYDQLENIDETFFTGVVLDESSILKSIDGATKNLLIEKFKRTPYKLCCSATPSPNDHMELGNHSEFLGGMTYNEMLAMFFVHDGGETSKWRLRKHAENDFWNYVLSWSIAIDNPKTLGFDSNGYDLPKLNYIEHLIDFEQDGMDLFGEAAVSATELHQDLKQTLEQRCHKVLEIIGDSKEQFLIWCLGNAEAEMLNKLIPNSVNVQGSDKPEVKAKNLLAFAKGEIQHLITKGKIASFGLNYQSSFNQIFVSYDFKFEMFYQQVRRQYRFGQKNDVNVHLIIPKSQMNVRKSILEKEKKHKETIHNLSKLSHNYEHKQNLKEKTMEIKTNDYWLMNGDCVQKTKEIPDKAVDLYVFSPPFSELYVYSDKIEDMGNSSSYEQFSQHFKFLIPEIKRTLKNGRICAVHCMDLPVQKGKEGFIGLRDFSGMLIDWFQEFGFIYHSRVTIWKNPVTEMQRTKALGLLHKTIKKDSSMSRVGIPDYVLFFRNEGENEIEIRHQDTDPSKGDYLPVDLWQKYASPVWYDIDYSRTLQYTTARDSNDEKHICPLQLDTIQRIIHLYSNEGETVCSPFGGIGSEGYQALKMKRKSISIELKESYFEVNKKNHKEAVISNSLLTLF